MILNFHPDLQYLFPERVDIEATTPLDALKLLAVQHPLNGKMEPVPVRIKQLREFDLVIDPTLADAGKVYEIVPANAIEVYSGYSGAGGDSGLMNIVIGVILIAVAVFAPYLAPAMMTATAAGGATVFAAGTFAAYAASAAMSIGISLVLTGAMQLLAPNKKTEVEGEYKSRAFGAATTTEVGTPIPIIFGRHLSYFHLFSFNVDARNYSGLDEPDKSPYFKGKADEFLPTINLNKFYGYLKAGDKVYLNQTDNETYRTGSEF